jgi:ribonuclease P protein component
MVLWIRTGEDAAGRLGVVSSKKVGNAVHRNLARRRLREAFRTQRGLFRLRCDVVIVARRNLIEATQEEVAREMRWLARRAGLMPGRDER